MVDEDIMAGFRGRQGQRATDAPAGAGDQRPAARHHSEIMAAG
jgi:hypothetical protein